MYVRAGSRAAISTDSRVQARTARRTRMQKRPGRRMHRCRELPGRGQPARSSRVRRDAQACTRHSWPPCTRRRTSRIIPCYLRFSRIPARPKEFRVSITWIPVFRNLVAATPTQVPPAAARRPCRCSPWPPAPTSTRASRHTASGREEIINQQIDDAFDPDSSTPHSLGPAVDRGPNDSLAARLRASIRTPSESANRYFPQILRHLHRWR
jgi:hypothetical protein